MKRRVLLIACLISFCLSVASSLMPTAEAGWLRRKIFRGGSVFDPVKYTQLLLQVEQVKKQLDNWEKETDHLKTMNESSSKMVRTYILTMFDRLIAIRNTAKGLTYNYAILQTEWDKTFKEFKTFNGISASEYAEHLKVLDEKTSLALLDAMRSQGLIVDFDGDRMVLKGLMEESKNSEGTLGALQVSNYIAALQMTQFLRMELIMTMSFRAQATYYQWLIQQKMSQRAYAKKNQIKMENPTSQLTGGTFPDF